MKHIATIKTFALIIYMAIFNAEHIFCQSIESINISANYFSQDPKFKQNGKLYLTPLHDAVFNKFEYRGVGITIGVENDKNYRLDILYSRDVYDIDLHHLLPLQDYGIDNLYFHYYGASFVMHHTGIRLSKSYEIQHPRINIVPQLGLETSLNQFIGISEETISTDNFNLYPGEPQEHSIDFEYREKRHKKVSYMLDPAVVLELKPLRKINVFAFARLGYHIYLNGQMHTMEYTYNNNDEFIEEGTIHLNPNGLQFSYGLRYSIPVKKDPDE